MIMSSIPFHSCIEYDKIYNLSLLKPNIDINECHYVLYLWLFHNVCMLLHLRRITYKIRQCTIYGTYAGNVSLKIVSYVIYMRTYQTVKTVYTVCIHMRNTRDFVIVKNKGPSTPVRTHVDYNLVLCLCCVASALYKKRIRTRKM